MKVCCVQEICGVQAEVWIVGELERGGRQSLERCQRYPVQRIVRRRLRDTGSSQNGVGGDAARFERTYDRADVSTDDSDVRVI